MKPKAIDISTAKHYTWGEDCRSFVLLDLPALSVKQEIIPPGTKEKLHYHNKAQQFFYVLKGEALFFVEGHALIIKQGQGIHIESGDKHFIENQIDESIEFLVISQPDTSMDRINVNDQ